jgi:hydrogenase expression/formation protein HypE
MGTNSPYPLGKLPAEHLARLLVNFAPPDERILIGPSVGHDAAVIAFGERCLVAKTDPITFASDEIGWYAVNVNANDIACLGATPRWFLATLLLPERSTDAALVDTIFGQIVDACGKLGIGLVGGHTEITHGLDRPIVVGCMLGEARADRLVRSDGARPGDALLLTKGIAVEGTAILAREKAAELAGLGEELLERCRRFLHDPGISVVRDAAAATAAGQVHAMHDPTEGGLATALLEMATAGRVGMVIAEDALPVLPETRAVCAQLGLEPLGLISSGALLLAVASADAAPILAGLRAAGISGVEIGRVVEPEHGLKLRSPQGERPLPHFERDEIARLFE